MLNEEEVNTQQLAAADLLHAAFQIVGNKIVQNYNFLLAVRKFLGAHLKNEAAKAPRIIFI